MLCERKKEKKMESKALVDRKAKRKVTENHKMNSFNQGVECTVQ